MKQKNLIFLQLKLALVRLHFTLISRSASSSLNEMISFAIVLECNNRILSIIEDPEFVCISTVFEPCYVGTALNMRMCRTETCETLTTFLHMKPMCGLARAYLLIISKIFEYSSPFDFRLLRRIGTL